MEFLDLLKEYGGYLALPVVINALMMACKKGIQEGVCKYLGNQAWPISSPGPWGIRWPITPPRVSSR